MQNSGSNNINTLLKELPGANVEFGQLFSEVLNTMARPDGITNPNASEFDVVSRSWKTRANNKNKTDDDNKQLSKELNESIRDLAKSYLLFIALETGNTTGKINYSQYETFILKHRFDYNSAELREKIKIAFDKISSHGTGEGEKLYIDKECMAEFLYALIIESDRDKDNNFKGFKIEGVIRPNNYAVSEHFLFEPRNDDMLSLKLKIAHNMLNR